MAAVRTYTLPHYDAYPVQVALFKDVKNADFLRSQLLAANPEFDYAFLDAAMVSLAQQFLSLSTISLCTRYLHPISTPCCRALRAHVSSHDRLTSYPALFFYTSQSSFLCSTRSPNSEL